MTGNSGSSPARFSSKPVSGTRSLLSDPRGLVVRKKGIWLPGTNIAGPVSQISRVSSFHMMPEFLSASEYENPGSVPARRPNRPPSDGASPISPGFMELATRAKAKNLNAFVPGLRMNGGCSGRGRQEKPCNEGCSFKNGEGSGRHYKSKLPYAASINTSSTKIAAMLETNYGYLGASPSPLTCATDAAWFYGRPRPRRSHWLVCPAQ